MSREKQPGQQDFASFTFGSMICDLDPDAPAMWVTPGPPSQHDYLRVAVTPKASA